MTHLAAGVANLVRIHTAGFEGLVFTIGPILTGWPGSFWGFASLWLIGILINGYIFALNDLVDLPYDKANPARSRSPLVDGRVSQRLALAISVSLPLAATAIVVLSRWPISAEIPFTSLLILGAFVNIYQKVTRHPLIMDLLFSVTMAAPIPVTAQALMHNIPFLAWSATVSLFFLALQLNSIGGNLKDLEADRRTGFHTVAVSHGASVAADGTLIPGNRYRRYCWCVHGITSLSLLVTTAGAIYSRSLPELLAVAILAVAACFLGARDLRRLLRGTRRPSPRGTQVYFGSGFSLLLVAVAAHSHLPAFLASFVLLIIWTTGFALYWWWYWRRSPVAPSPSLET
ncbi:MAG TPA: UbiA family prenyltransferase [Streptosporangiaceae bacterium]|nr:UbiA family prenyltransferase [Streptosporangiaceae bacterium]HVB45673.1 UbiA family prenyltransferase [Streptosporangiaceae bacterium]